MKIGRNHRRDEKIGCECVDNMKYHETISNLSGK
jgi:hypothetical protein